MLAALLFVLGASVHGRVVLAGDPVPGVEVSLAGQKVLTDAQGRYAFSDVPFGAYDITYELQGLPATKNDLRVRNEKVEVPDAALKIPTTNCAMAIVRCGDAPKSQWDDPACADYQLDLSLEKSVEAGDRSAIDLLEKRFQSAFTTSERTVIVRMLLGRVSDDSRYWNHVLPLAEDAVRFGDDRDETREKFEKYCEERGLRPMEYQRAMFDALAVASSDPRSRPLLMRVVTESSDYMLLACAIAGLAEQRDESALPAIEKALERNRQEATDLAWSLAFYKSPAADAITFKYIAESDRDEYRKLQQ